MRFFLAVEKTVPAAEQPESPEAAAVRELLKLLVKAQKARRLYQAKNAISDRLQAELFSKISSHFEEQGSFTLIIREFRIMLGEDLVYESNDRNDSLAFLLFRDGIRRLSFHPGLEEKELQDFLKCLNRVALLSNEQDDLVTLFWDADFKSIKYFAVEELNAETDGPRLEEQLSSGTSEGHRGSGTAPDAADLKDIEQPVAHLPVEACSLKEHEIEALRAELAQEEQDPFGLAVVELAIDLTLLEPGREQRKELAKNTIDIFNRLLAERRSRGGRSSFRAHERSGRDGIPKQREGAALISLAHASPWRSPNISSSSWNTWSLTEVSNLYRSPPTWRDSEKARCRS